MQNQNLIEFDQQQIEDAIFHKKLPTVVLFPFPVGGIFSGVSVQVEVRSSFLPSSPINILCSVVKRVDDVAVDGDWVKKQIPQVIHFLWKAYDVVIDSWTRVCRKTIEEICKSQVSKSYWILEKSSLESSVEVTVERGLWILHNNYREETEKLDISVKLRDSILPWLQPEMYWKWKDRQESTQVNVDYEKQRAEMMAGTFGSEDLDIIE